MQQLESLGDHTKEWELFQDGYVNGRRIYEREIGLTCHQCRQKTLGRRTHCSKCKQRRGQFCGDCLWMRYGENVEEANANPEWTCPVCRDICNCSFCRNKKGWAPTGIMYQWVKSKGFKSVAHYLVMTFLDVSEVGISGMPRNFVTPMLTFITARNSTGVLNIHSRQSAGVVPLHALNKAPCHILISSQTLLSVSDE